MLQEFDAIYDHGVLRPVETLALAQGTRLHLRVESEQAAPIAVENSGRILSPRLAHPDQIGDFAMEVREVEDAEL